MQQSRIEVIDGFRAIAILGVLWAHVWMFFDNPVLLIKGKDISPIFSFWGNGVDLFFVISGFCMYLMQFSKNDKLTLHSFSGFLKKRFIRIAPAFYIAIVVYCLLNVLLDKSSFNYQFALTNLFFINTLTKITGPAPHFWSLNTEWHFYFLLPILMLLFGKKKNVKKNILALLFVLILIRFFIWQNYNDPYNLINYSIANRLIEFFVGMIVCKIYIENKIPEFCKTNYFFIFAFFIAFLGRILMTASFKLRIDFVGVFARVFDLPLLTFGFGLMIVATLNNKIVISKFIQNKFFLFIGKYSYSMYLWHWIIAAICTNYLKKYLVFHPFVNVNIVFLISLIFLIPVSILSYQIFEQFYFKYFSKKNRLSTTN